MHSRTIGLDSFLLDLKFTHTHKKARGNKIQGSTWRLVGSTPIRTYVALLDDSCLYFLGCVIVIPSLQLYLVVQTTPPFPAPQVCARLRLFRARFVPLSELSRRDGGGILNAPQGT